MSITGLLEFRGQIYEVSLAPGPDAIRVRVRLNVKSWANTFTSAYLDELTKKTGSYKDYNTFVNMIAAAVTNPGAGDCTLQLLSPSDLDALRVQNQARPSRQLGDRRYLLLVYQNQFEKTHFPLSLLPEPIPPSFTSNVQSTPINTRIDNSDELHTIVKQLQEEIRRLKQPDEPNYRSKYEELVLENNDLQKQLATLKDEIKTSQNTKHQRQMRKLVDEMLNELTGEKARCKKIVSQKNGQIHKLESELDELRTDNRSLEIRVRALNNELQTYKRGRTGRYPIRTISRESSRDRNIRQKSQERRSVRNSRPPVYRQAATSSRLSQRSRSRDPSPAGSIRSRGSVASSVASSTGSHKSNGSKQSSTRKRFDPTAYIKAKKEKEKDNQRRNKRARTPVNYHSRENSYNSKFSGRSSGRTRSSTPDPNLVQNDSIYSNSNQMEDSLINGGSFNIAEIDARLSALQQYMNDLAT